MDYGFSHICIDIRMHAITETVRIPFLHITDNRETINEYSIKIIFMHVDTVGHVLQL